MTQFSQWQRLYSDHSVIDEIVNPKVNDDLPEKKRSHYHIQLDIPDYEALLVHLQVESEEVRNYWQVPHPPGARILQNDVVPKATLRILEHVSISMIKPNNCIVYKLAGKTYYGLVRQIYQFNNPFRKRENVILVNPIKNLFPKLEQTPSRFFRYILFLHKCVVGQIDEEFVYVLTKKVVNVAAYRLLPTDVFGIDEGEIILRPYDYTSQLDIS